MDSSQPQLVRPSSRFIVDTGCEEFSVHTCHACELLQKFYIQFLLSEESEACGLQSSTRTSQSVISVWGRGKWGDFFWNVGVEPFKQECVDLGLLEAFLEFLKAQVCSRLPGLS